MFAIRVIPVTVLVLALCGHGGVASAQGWGMGMGGGNEGPDGYSAALTSGAFDFGPAAAVTPNKRGTSYHGDSDTPLEMIRPDYSEDPAGYMTWNNLFAACVGMLPLAAIDIDAIDVDDWTINSAGKTDDNDVRIRFKDATVDGFPQMTIDFDLIGTTQGVPFIPESGQTSTFTLTAFVIFGRDRHVGGCSSDGSPPLTPPFSTLEITAP